MCAWNFYPNPTQTLYEQTRGRNTIITLHTNTDANQAYLNVIQKGKTRGLTIWTNPSNEVLLCSREKPTLLTFTKILKENNYQKITHITRNHSVNLEAHFNLDLNLQQHGNSHA